MHSEHEFDTINRPDLRCPWTQNRMHGGHPGGRHAFKHWRQHWRQHMQQQQQARQQTQPSQSTTNLHETLNNFMPHIASSIPMVYNQEQLKNVGEYLKQFLDPFGIDVSYYVDNLSGKNNSNGTNSTTTTTSSSSTTTSSTEKKEEKKPSDEEQSEKPLQEEKPTPMQTETEKVEKTISDSTTTASAPEKEDMIDLTKLTPSTSMTNATQSLFQAAAAALQNVVENSKSDDAITAAAASTATVTSKPPTRSDQEFNGFNLIDMEKEIKFINCIEQLKGMGYSDDGGWLTRLVISKDGNIHTVLDSLHPSKN